MTVRELYVKLDRLMNEGYGALNVATLYDDGETREADEIIKQALEKLVIID